MTAAPHQIKALLFDKDGTLFDFRETWENWAAALIRRLAEGDALLEQALCTRLGFDLQNVQFHPGSFVIAGTNLEVAQAICEILGHSDVAAMEEDLARSAMQAPLAEAAPLGPLCAQLRGAGYPLGIMTNDAESVAFAHADRAGVRAEFEFIIGSDSGFGAKPDPAPLLAFCRHVGLDPFRVAMVGDSTHDLQAAAAAGMTGIGVLTGMATAAELAPYADHILNDIGELPGWLGLSGGL